VRALLILRGLCTPLLPKHSLFPNPDDVATNDVTPRGKGGKGGDSASVKRVSASTPTTSLLPVTFLNRELLQEEISFWERKFSAGQGKFAWENSSWRAPRGKNFFLFLLFSYLLFSPHPLHLEPQGYPCGEAHHLFLRPVRVLILCGPFFAGLDPCLPNIFGKFHESTFSSSCSATDASHEAVLKRNPPYGVADTPALCF